VLAERDVRSIVNGDARTVARAMAPLVVASMLVALIVVYWSLRQPPRYEATAMLLVGESLPAPPAAPATRVIEAGLKKGGGEKIQLIPLAPTPERLEKVSQAMVSAIDSRPVAEETIRRLGLGVAPGELLDDLRVQPEVGTTFFRLTYADADPARARQIANTVGQAAHDYVRDGDFTVALWASATLPDAPVSPRALRNGLIALVAALTVSAGLLVGRRALGR
jgi:uncharacterized protein involved in exopolysaccharide biosynthesis